MQYTEYQGKKIAYQVSGEKNGKCILLLHGFCADHRTWDEWLPLLPDQYKYIRVDIPGFGQSELLDDQSIDSIAEAVNAVVEAEDIEKFMFIGHSMGGYTALAFAEKYGDKLEGLCMFNSQAHADTDEKKAGRLKSIDFIQRNGHVLYVKQLIPKLFAYDYSKGYPAEVNRLIYQATKYLPEAIIASTHAMRNRPDRQHVLENIKCPVLFFIGKKDNAVTFENSMAQTSLPDIADIHIYPDAGHMCMFETPRQTAKALRKFLNTLNSE